MNKYTYPNFTKLIVCFLLLLGIDGCQPKSNERNGNLTVVTTTGMIYDAVVNIGKDKVKAEALMGPGVDPHLYKATQGDLEKLQTANLIFYSGLHLEGKMGEVFEKLGRTKPVVAVSDNINKNYFRESEAFQGTYDPHIWFDVSLWMKAVRNVEITLSQVDSVNADFYHRNAEKYLFQLDSLHQRVMASISEIPKKQRLLITAHDAFGYFGDAYHIEVNGLQGISTLSEPGLKDVSDLVNLIVDRNIKAVFVETSVSKKAIEAVIEGCHQRGHEVIIGGSLFSDAMGSFDTFEGTYIGMVHTNVEIIKQALK